METKLADRERPKDDPTPPEKEPPVVHQDVKGVQGDHVTVDTVNAAGVVNQNTTFISQVQDTRESLQQRISILETKMEARQKEWEDRKLQIQNLQGDLLQQQQDYAKTENISQANDQIHRLTTEIEMHTSKLAMLEDDILPTLKVQIERVQEQLAEYEKTAPEKMKALKEQMQTLSEDVKTYGANVADGRKKVEDLFKQIQQLEKDISDKRKHQEAKMKHDAVALRDIQDEQARQKKQLESLFTVVEMISEAYDNTNLLSSDGNRAIEELQRATQKQDDEMKKMKSDNIKLKDEKEAAERKTQKQDDEMKKMKSDNIKLKDKKEAAERKIKELEATHVKTIQDLTEQNQKASTEPSKIPSQSESVSHFPLTTQESDQHASSDPSRTKGTPVTTTKKPDSHATSSPAVCDGLHDASRDADLEEVKRLLSFGVDVNCMGVGRWTPVMKAARGGQRDVVEFLRSEGADVSLVNKDGDNILHLACIGGDVETVKYVLSLNAVDINSRGMGSRTPVAWAAVEGHRDVVEFLRSEGADVSLVDGDGNNILHLACIEGDMETVKYVLSLNVVDINSRGRGSLTPVMRAAYRGYRDVVELLVSRGADGSLVDKHGNNILHFACHRGHLKTVEFVLSLNVVDINSRGQGSRTPVIMAAYRGYRDVVELLVSRGADGSLVDKHGNNILHFACHRGHLKTVEFVLSLNVVDINSRGQGSLTPVMRAAHNGHKNVVELLVSKGADVSLVDVHGDNTLHYACIGGHLETVEFVLSLNVVDIDARDKWENTAADWASSNGHTRVAYLLVSRGAQ